MGWRRKAQLTVGQLLSLEVNGGEKGELFYPAAPDVRRTTGGVNTQAEQ